MRLPEDKHLGSARADEVSDGLGPQAESYSTAALSLHTMYLPTIGHMFVSSVTSSTSNICYSETSLGLIDDNF